MKDLNSDPLRNHIQILKVEMSVDETPIFGAQSLREIIQENKQGGSMNLSKEEYLIGIQRLVNRILSANAMGVNYVNYVEQFAAGRVIADLSREELAVLYTSANKAHMAEANVKTIAAMKVEEERHKLGGTIDEDPTARFIASQPWGRQ